MGGKLTFNGGIHPYDGKDLSKDKPIRDILPKGDLVYPLSQHIGAPAKPVVKKGDHVLTGQLIAEAGGFVSAPVYATVSGTVKAIEPHRTVVGDNVMSVVIENDGQYEEVDYGACKPLADHTKEEIIQKIQKAGVVGMGGAGFPAHVKLSPKEPDKIDYVIVNGAECEPYLTSDYRRMIEEPQKVIDGLRCELALFDNAKGIIAIENNKPDCIEKMKELTRDDDRILVKALKTKYPQGSERQLIYASTGRAINCDMLPSDVGCIVNNVDTVCAIGVAVLENKPLMYRIVTVTGDAITDPCNFRVRIGTNYHELIEEAGGFKQEPAAQLGCFYAENGFIPELDGVSDAVFKMLDFAGIGRMMRHGENAGGFKQEPAKIISGGPMMGFGIFDLDVPTTKTASALLCLTKDDVSAAKTGPCINCGMCVEVCPGRVVPSRLAKAAEHGDKESFVKMNGMECCECGCCSFICPAKRPLTQEIKSMRKMILADRKKK